VCVSTPEPFRAVGLWYEQFTQTSDEEVTRLLAEPLERNALWEAGEVAETFPSDL
jgi:predicted phosphoribosyltransferase